MAPQNTLFALFATTNPAAIKLKLESPQSKFLFYATSSESWFLIAPNDLTTIEVSDLLGITDGTSGQGIVVRAEQYWGRASNTMWEWVAVKTAVTT